MNTYQRNIYYSCSHDDQTLYDIHQLFQYYNIHFFANILENCSVRWTNRMTQCAGTCKHEGYGSSTISLSEPLLKFRSGNQVKETLIHEMIHAYLFKTDMEACKINGGHGPAFVEIMNKINKITGLNITIYHSFHDEVEYYRRHIWRCNGRCREQPPFYGFVKRSMNRPPQPADYWFASHRRTCGGEFSKISQPQKPQKKQKNQNNKNKQKKSKRLSKDKTFSNGKGKTLQDYITQMSNKQQKNKQKATKNTKIPSSQNKSSPNPVSMSTNQQLSKQQARSSLSIFQYQKGKSIEDYCREIQEQKRNKFDEQDRCREDDDGDQDKGFMKLLEKYRKTQNLE